MESCENLFALGKYVECSRALEVLLKREHNSTEESLDVRFSHHIQHNKIVSDALSHNWFDEEADSNELHQVWCSTFTKLTDLCKILRCDLLTSNIGQEVFLVSTLNLLSWSWENLGDHFDGYIDQINKLTMFSLQTELSSCGESALETESILDLAELFKKCIWRIPPHQCHVLLDTICLSFLHMLRLETCDQVLTRCLRILEGLLQFLPQVHIHLTKAPARKSPALFLLGPNIASVVNDPNLSVNLLLIVTVLYLLRLKHYDKAWHFLEKDSCAKHKNVEVILEYIKAIVCLRRKELDISLYHISYLSSMPSMESNMIKRKNIISAWIHILKGNPGKALECLRDVTGLPEDEDQLPIHVYLMAHCYGALGQPEQQLVLLDCVIDVLREDPRYASSRVTPISSLQDRLLRCLHHQPELSLVQTLLASAEVCMKSSQPEKASEHLLEALRQIKCCPELRERSCDFVKVRTFESVMRDAVVSLLKCGNVSKARILCNGLMDSHILEAETFLNQAITRILLSDVQSGGTEERQTILIEAVRLLKKQKETSSDGHKTKFDLIDSLMARAFYRKAKLYSSIGYNDDATAYFKRALKLKPGDVIVLQEYQRHLFMIGKTDEARELLEKIQTQQTSSQKIEDLCSEGYITMNYLINEKVMER